MSVRSQLVVLDVEVLTLAKPTEIAQLSYKNFVKSAG